MVKSSCIEEEEFSLLLEAAATNNRIAFEHQLRIYSVNPNGTVIQQLTPDGSAYGPAYSPDGTKIAYSTNSLKLLRSQ
jgi:Tol biopolymer transport system component